MSKMKKFFLWGFSSVAVLGILWTAFVLYAVTYRAPYWNVSAEMKEMYRDVEVVAIENTVDDKDGKLTEMGLDITALNVTAVKEMEDELRRKLPQRNIKAGILDQPYNLGNPPNTLVVSLHWEVQGDKYRKTLKVKRKVGENIKERGRVNPMNAYIRNLIPVSKTEAKDQLLKGQKEELGSVVQSIEQCSKWYIF